MLRTKAIRKITTSRDIIHSMSVMFLLFSVLLCSTPAIGRDEADHSGLVYCPLQKAWVKATPDIAVIEEKEPLQEICAPVGNKVAFLSDLLKAPLFSKQSFKRSDNESLFFDYLKKGKRAIVELNNRQNLPDSQLLKIAAVTKATTSSFRYDFVVQNAQPDLTSVLPRPPTKNSRQPSFDIQVANHLEKISRNINPRSPPRTK